MLYFRVSRQRLHENVQKCLKYHTRKSKLEPKASRIQNADGVWAVISDFLIENHLQRTVAQSPETAYAFWMTEYLRKQARRHKSLLYSAEIGKCTRKENYPLNRSPNVQECSKHVFGRTMRNMFRKENTHPFFKKKGSTVREIIIRTTHPR